MHVMQPMCPVNKAAHVQLLWSFADCQTRAAQSSAADTNTDASGDQTTEVTCNSTPSLSTAATSDYQDRKHVRCAAFAVQMQHCMMEREDAHELECHRQSAQSVLAC